MNGSADRIFKQVVLRAPLARVWDAITDSAKFGSWFGVELDGPFVVGSRVTGRIVPTRVDRDVADKQKAVAGLPVEWLVERIEPMRAFSFKWHPFAIDPAVDYSNEPMTTVLFELEPVPEGTRLTITESGFDRIPLERRATAFTSNDQGWTIQARLIGKFLDGAGAA